jgi:hypothetical protein
VRCGSKVGRLKLKTKHVSVSEANLYQIAKAVQTFITPRFQSWRLQVQVSIDFNIIQE